MNNKSISGVIDSDLLKSLCSKLGYICLILGIVGSIATAYVYGRTADQEWLLRFGEVRYERNWGMTFGVFAGSLLAELILCAILFALAYIIESVEGNAYKLYTLETKVDSLEEKITEIANRTTVKEESSEDVIDELPEI